MPPEPKGSIQVLQEPAELELEALDGSLLLANLQSAFPAAVGLYYRGHASGKAVVKFDGRKFHAPEGGWQGKQYYVNLGASVASTSSANTYVGATKQFEKSVSVVQGMMESLKHTAHKPMLPICDANEPYKPYFNGNNTNKTVKRPYENGTEKTKQSSMQQQLIDLAQLNACKEAIITSQREQLSAVNKELEEQHTKLANLSKKMMDCEAKCSALNDELELFRSMGKEQDNMCKEIRRLERRLYETEMCNRQKILELENALEEKQQQVFRLVKRLEQDNNTMLATESKLQNMQLECQKLHQIEVDLRSKSQLQIEQLENELEKSEKCKEELLMTNLRIHRLNEQLHTDIDECRKECERIEKEGKQNVLKATKQLVNRNLLLEEQTESQRIQIIDFSSVLESMAKENRLLLEKLQTICCKEEHT